MSNHNKNNNKRIFFPTTSHFPRYYKSSRWVYCFTGCPWIPFYHCYSWLTYVFIVQLMCSVSVSHENTTRPYDSFFSFEGQLCTFSWVLSLLGRYFYNTYRVKMFETVFSFNVKDNNIFPCLHNIKLSYNMLQCFVNQNVYVYIKL